MILQKLHICKAPILIHVSMQQLPKQFPMYIEKKHNVSQKIADISFRWHPVIYFNPVIFQLEHLSLLENTEAHSFQRP